ncbi:MAG: 50S ribosomal protein L3 [Rickettsiales bacterium]|nr:50S ribosomal protein L3 [Rickettsiales bacterium]
MASNLKNNLRTGVLAEKLGMTRIFAEDGKNVPVTLFKVEGNIVTSVKTTEKNGYTAVQLGFGEKKVKNIAKPQREEFAKNKVPAKAHLREFRVPAEKLLNIGDEISASHFVVGQKVDVAGITIGRGFQGVMKRHNFAGLEASHGVSISHRSHGSTGQRQDPGRVFKNKKMAGHMGAVRATQQGLKVILVDAEKGLIAIKGSTPGFEGSIVEIRDAIKVKNHKDLPVPAGLKAKA